MAGWSSATRWISTSRARSSRPRSRRRLSPRRRRAARSGPSPAASPPRWLCDRRRPAARSHAFMVGHLAPDYPEEEPGPGVAHVGELLVQRLLRGVEVAQGVEVFLESAVLGVELEHPARVGGDRLELLAVADHPRAAHQAVDVLWLHARDALGVEVAEGFLDARPLGFDDAPADACLEHHPRHRVEVAGQLLRRPRLLVLVHGVDLILGAVLTAGSPTCALTSTPCRSPDNRKVLRD